MVKNNAIIAIGRTKNYLHEEQTLYIILKLDFLRRQSRTHRKLT